jgi:predicted nuclease of predicted toxin-antitoxin system
MRLLLDESVPRRLRRFLPGHTVRTVVEMGWGGIGNGELLALSANEFDALITVDKNLQYQQNLDALPISVIVLDAKSNEIPYLLPLVPKLEEVLASLVARRFVRIEA